AGASLSRFGGNDPVWPGDRAGVIEGGRNHAVSDIFGNAAWYRPCAGPERLSVPLAPDRVRLSRPDFDSPDDREPSRQAGRRRGRRPSTGGDDRVRGGRVRARL